MVASRLRRISEWLIGLKLGRAAISVLALAQCAFLLGISGCASTGVIKPSSAGAAGGQTPVNAWWYASFRVDWPEGEDPALDTDLLIAHTIVKPVLDRHEKEISLWRFHRRAARDDAGHRFSFIFYATAANAGKIYAEIGSSPILHRLKTGGVVLHVSMDNTHTISRPQIEDTSDPNWSPALKKAWPYFIMGVSRTWLDLISQYAEDGRTKPFTLAETQAFYRQIAQEVEAAWKKEGGHAFLHHLNALFGYGPVSLGGKMEMRF